MIKHPEISVIIPCLNEENNLKELLPLLKKNGAKTTLEIIVVDGGSVDDSVLVADSLGAIVYQCDKPSRACQLNTGAFYAKGPILYFVHADTRPGVDFGKTIIFANEQNKSSGCFRYKFDSELYLLKINSWFTQFNGILSGGGDQSLFIRKTLFEELSGFNPEFCVMEDFDLVRRIRKHSDFHVLDVEILVSARKYESNSWIRVQAANFMAFSLFLLKVEPKAIKSLYLRLLSNKELIA